jgi:radial spoke head protein 4A
MASISELRQILKQDQSGNNLYDHLTETIMKILLDRPSNAYDMFEKISSDVKMNPLNPESTNKAVPPSSDEVEKQLNWAKSCSALLKRPDEPPEQNVAFPDLMSEASLFEWAGISFGRSDTYRLYLSIKTFAETLPAEVERLRFFGMIKTRGSPYFVVEGLNADEDEFDEKRQEGKSGANKYSYWVTQSVESGSWFKLPNVTMAQVVAARKFKKYLSGNLEAPVVSFPPFDGNENNLLRALIALIGGSTCISPAGYFELDEDSDPPVVKLAEAEAINENFPKPAQDLKEPDAWVHHEIELNALGRVTAMPEETDENGDVIEPDEPVETVPPLKGIEGEQWSLRLGPGGAGEFAGSVVYAKSLVWPGAVAVAEGKRFVNIYVGYGVKYEAKTYSPPLPAALQVEWAPEEEEEPLVENEDVRTDPTPPQAEEEEED